MRKNSKRMVAMAMKVAPGVKKLVKRITGKDKPFPTPSSYANNALVDRLVLDGHLPYKKKVRLAS